MKKEKLIEELQKLPDGMEVCILDWRKNLSADNIDGSGMGVYPDFQIECIDKDSLQKGASFVVLNFNNVDYNEDGSVAG